MIKRAILAACVAAFAFAALPAIAAAEEVTNNPGDAFLEGAKEGTTFTVAGAEAKLIGSAGTIKCKKNSAEGGTFFDTETGSLKLIFKECTSPLGTACTTAGEAAGVIKTTTLPFHLKAVIHEEVKKPGILITPGPNNAHGTHFATFECGLVGKIEVGGNGIIGTIIKPEKEGEKSKTATIKFAPVSAGSTTQTHRFVIEHQRETEGLPRIEWDLKTRLNEGETKTAAEEAEGVITLDGEAAIQTTPTP